MISPQRLNFGEKTPSKKKGNLRAPTSTSTKKIQPSSMSSKKVQPNRNVDSIKTFDNYNKHLFGLFDTIKESIGSINIPVHHETAQPKNEKSDIEKLNELLECKKNLENNGIDSTVIHKLVL